MSRGKYSPVCPYRPANYEFRYNCHGEIPAEWSQDLFDSGVEYDEKSMFGGCDEEGYDSYGYSSFDQNGNYVGHGRGVDREGYTELDYLTLQDIPEEHRGSYYYFNS